MAAPIGLLALKRFELLYEQLDAALDDGDALTVAALMTRRGAIVDELVECVAAGHGLPTGGVERIAEQEARLHARMESLRDRLRLGLRRQRRRGHAVRCYAQVNHEPNTTGGQRR
ncbi:MAG: hypothetical protein CSA66_06150 [Proteobacteria bacterium]|nr:MAG: hypothetical protein CSA66_06150 [Pseudomonadota bacterium]